MTNLNSLQFTTGNDRYSDAEFQLINSTVNTLSGNDTLTATLSQGSTFRQTFFIGGGVLRTDGGNDTIIGDGGAGFQCNGLQLFNPGIDTKLETGSGDDQIIGIGSAGGAGGFGISNFGARIDTGSGNDVIIGRSAAVNLGIFNFGTIEMGTGNDQMIASGLINGGQISMGSGNDVIKVETPSSSGGTIDLGTGDDLISGVNSGRIEGSFGRDSVLLSAGRYEVRKTDAGFRVGDSLFLSGIEGIGSAQSQSVLALQSGILNISDSGLAAFV